MDRGNGQHWGIVGGGLLGMTLARRLAQRGQTVTLLEAADHLGGLASAWQLGDCVWDRHYHVLLLSDAHLRNLLAELELADEVVWNTTRTGFYTDDTLYSLSNAIEFLRFPPLSLLDKLRLGATIWRAAHIKDWQALERLSVSEWLTRWSGRRTFEKIWRPLLRAKLGENYHHASAAFIWAIIARMYAARRTGLKKEMFGYVRGGYARILERFGEVLRADGVDIRLSQSVRGVASREEGVHVSLGNGTEEIFDRVVLTIPTPHVDRLCPGLSEEEHQRLRNIRYQGVLCASVLLRKPLAGYYVTNITEPWVPFTAVIEMTSLVDPQEFRGRHLVYLPRYLASDDPAFNEPDELIQERFLTALARMYPHFDRSDVLAFQISRARLVLAVTTLHYSEQIPPMMTSLPNVHIVNSAQIVNGTLNVNETIQLAERAVETLLQPTTSARPVRQEVAIS